MAKVTILIGPNGCDKSTLLKTMACILAPSRGHVLLDGKQIHTLNTRAVAARLGKRHHGKGRVFYSSPGHLSKEFEVPQMRTILLRGLNWAAR